MQEKNRGTKFLCQIHKNQTARVTFPERRQRVQTLTDFVFPFTTALTFLMLAFQVLFDLLCEWLTLIPKVVPFPQISHFAIYIHLQIIDNFHKTISILTDNFQFCKIFFKFFKKYFKNLNL